MKQTKLRFESIICIFEGVVEKMRKKYVNDSSENKTGRERENSKENM